MNKRLLLLACGSLIAACSPSTPQLKVSTYHLRESLFKENDDPMVRGEVQRLLHGCVSQQQRLAKVGDYYEFHWQDPQPRAIDLRFDYLQAATGSKVQTRRVHLPMPQRSLRYSMAITGTEYQKGGRILAWKASVERDGTTLASQQSYLWK